MRDVDVPLTVRILRTPSSTQKIGPYFTVLCATMMCSLAAPYFDIT